MADISSPGILVIIDDVIYYKKVEKFEQVKKEIDAIKEDLMKRAGYEILNDADKVQLQDAHGDDIRKLLSLGITIRPLGR